MFQENTKGKHLKICDSMSAKTIIIKSTYIERMSSAICTDENNNNCLSPDMLLTGITFSHTCKTIKIWF